MARNWGLKLLLVVFVMSGCGKFRAKDESGNNLFSLGAVGSNQRQGAVTASNRALKDSQGEFYALGTTVMWALWAMKNDRPKLEAELAFLSENGYDYIRVLGTLGRDYNRQITYDRHAQYWQDRWMTSDWEDYDKQIADLTDLAYDQYGLRVEWTIFGGAEGYNESERHGLVDRFLSMSRGREHKIIHFEIGNESWQTGFDHDAPMMRRLSAYMKGKTDILVAASAPQDAGNCESIQDFYAGDVADIGTMHFDRNIGMADNYWRPVRQPWEYTGFMHNSCGAPKIGSNNEPIGPGASVSADSDQYRLVAAAMVTYISGLPLYVYHTDQGVFGRSGPISGTPAATSFVAMKSLLPNNITNWQGTHTGRPDSPFAADAIWPADNTNFGIVRAYGARSGNQFLQLPMGIKNYTQLTANQNLRFDAYDIVSGEKKGEACLRAGEKVKLTGLSVFLLKGELTSACTSTANVTIGGTALTAPPQPVPSGPTFKLRVAMTSSQSGSIGQVTGTRGFNCTAGICEKLYAAGSSVTLNGVSTSGNQFLYFRNGGDNPCGIQASGESLAMDRDRDCIAVFENSAVQTPAPTPTPSPNPTPGGSNGCYPAVSATDDHGAILEAATFVKQNYPQYFQAGTSRAQAYEMMGIVINMLRGSGKDAKRTVAWPDRGASDPYRYASDAMVLGNTNYDIYLGWPDQPGNPHVSNHGAASAPGNSGSPEHTSDLVAIGSGPRPCGTTQPPTPTGPTFKLRVAMVSVQGQSTGLVTAEGLTCDEGMCEKVYSAGSHVTLQAANSDGNRFLRFQNGEHECGINGSGQSVIMDRDRDCVAVFEATSSSPPPSSGFAAGSLNLSAGQGVSNNGYELNFQHDGNLVVYRNGSPVWASNTQQSCNSGCSANFQHDGNLVLYKDGNPYWASNTSGSRLTLGGSGPEIR